MKLVNVVLFIYFFLSVISLTKGNGIISLKLGIDKIDTVTHHKYPKPKKHHHPPPPSYTEGEKWERYNDCMFVKRYSISQRLKQYPFSKALKILAVSYPSLTGPNQDIVVDSGSKTPLVNNIDTLKYNLHVRNKLLDSTSLIEIKPLNKLQIDKLTNLLYNTRYKRKNPIAHPGAECFEPRNALIFINRYGKVFDYLEVCFECNRMTSFSNRVFFKSSCNQQIDYLKKYFIEVGIKYGTLEK